MIAYKFVKWDVPSLETLKSEEVYQLKEKVLKNQKLTNIEKDRLFSMLFGSSYSKTAVLLHGWMFDFSGILHTYYVEFNYGSIEKYHAPNKMSIRNNMNGIRKITEI